MRERTESKKVNQEAAQTLQMKDSQSSAELQSSSWVTNKKSDFKNFFEVGTIKFGDQLPEENGRSKDCIQNL